MDAAPAAATPEQPRRTGGRRYRNGRPPPEQPPAADAQDAETIPFPAVGFRARGSLAGLFVICLVSCLLAAWLRLPLLAGLGVCAGSALAARYAQPAALLRIVVAVPAVFGVAEILAQLATLPGGGRRGVGLPVLEGTMLTLAAVAPWLFAGTAGAVIIALFRGLPRCVRELRADLTGRRPRPPTAHQGKPSAAGVSSYRATERAGQRYRGY